jgi:hypothetical protein
MYCPKCSQQQLSEQVRFCSRCGFNLDTVKASLAADGGVAMTPAHPRQRDVNIGVTLMFFGTLLAYGLLVIGGSFVGLAGGFLLLATLLISILLFSHPILLAAYKLLSLKEPSSSQFLQGRRGMSFGAMLMFIGAILSTCVAAMVPGNMGEAILLLVVLVVFALLLLSSQRLMWAVQGLLTGEEAQPIRPVGSDIDSAASRGPALLLAEDLPVTVSGAGRIVTGEIVQPPSVTERTTNLLDGK